MNYERISQLHFLLNEEFKKPTIDYKRVAEVQYYLSQEYLQPPVEPVKSFWDFNWVKLPDNWKLHVSALIGAAVALNSQLHLVTQNVQDALLAAAIALGFYGVNAAQNVQFDKLKAHVTSFGARMGFGQPPERK